MVLAVIFGVVIYRKRKDHQDQEDEEPSKPLPDPPQEFVVKECLPSIPRVPVTRDTSTIHRREIQQQRPDGPIHSSSQQSRLNFWSRGDLKGGQFDDPSVGASVVPVQRNDSENESGHGLMDTTTPGNRHSFHAIDSPVHTPSRSSFRGDPNNAQLQRNSMDMMARSHSRGWYHDHTNQPELQAAAPLYQYAIGPIEVQGTPVHHDAGTAGDGGLTHSNSSPNVAVRTYVPWRGQRYYTASNIGEAAASALPQWPLRDNMARGMANVPEQDEDMLGGQGTYHRGNDWMAGTTSQSSWRRPLN